MVRKTKVDTTLSAVITNSNQFPPEATTPDKDDLRMQVFPLRIYEGFNYLPTEYGVKSYFGLAPTEAISIPTGLPPQDHFVYQTEFYSNAHITLARDGIYVNGTRVVEVDEPAPDTDLLWTRTTIDNITFIYRQGSPKVYILNEALQDDPPVKDKYFNGLAASLTEEGRRSVTDGFIVINSFVPTTLNMEGQVGIYNIKGSLGFWDVEDAVAWSALNDFTEFTPSLSTLANIAKLEGVRGHITTILPHGDGAIVYATNSIVGIKPDTLSVLRFKSEVILEKAGVSYPKEVVAATPSTTHIAYTAAGFMQIVDFKASNIVPQLTDFLRPTRTPQYLQMMNNRYLIVNVMAEGFLEGNVELSTTEGDKFEFEWDDVYLDREGLPEEYIDGNTVCLLVTDAETTLDPSDTWSSGGGAGGSGNNLVSKGEVNFPVCRLPLFTMYYPKLRDSGVNTRERTLIYNDGSNRQLLEPYFWTGYDIVKVDANTAGIVDEWSPLRTSPEEFVTDQADQFRWILAKEFYETYRIVAQVFNMKTHLGEATDVNDYLLNLKNTHNINPYVETKVVSASSLLSQLESFRQNLYPTASPSGRFYNPISTTSNLYLNPLPDGVRLGIDPLGRGNDVLGNARVHTPAIVTDGGLGIQELASAPTNYRNAFRAREAVDLNTLPTVEQYYDRIKELRGDDFDARILPNGTASTLASNPLVPKGLHGLEVREMSKIAPAAVNRPIGVGFTSYPATYTIVDMKVTLYDHNDAARITVFRVDTPESFPISVSTRRQLHRTYELPAGAIPIPGIPDLYWADPRPLVVAYYKNSSYCVLRSDGEAGRMQALPYMNRIGTADPSNAPLTLAGSLEEPPVLPPLDVFDSRNGLDSQTHKALVPYKRGYIVQRSSTAHYFRALLYNSSTKLFSNARHASINYSPSGPTIPDHLIIQPDMYAEWQYNYPGQLPSWIPFLAEAHAMRKGSMYNYPGEAFPGLGSHYGMDGDMSSKLRTEFTQRLVCGTSLPIHLPATQIDPIIYDGWQIEGPPLTWTMHNGNKAPVAPIFYGAYVYDMHLEKWGVCKQRHGGFIDYQAVSNHSLGIVPYQNFLIESGALIEDNGSWRPCLFTDNPAESYVKYGKYKHTQHHYTTIEQARVRFNEPSTGAVGLSFSLDGRHPTYGQTRFATFLDATYTSMGCDLSGKWASLIITGKYDITSIEITSTSKGDR